MIGSRVWIAGGIAFVCLVSAPQLAQAQAAPAKANKTSATSKWELEAFGGLSLGRLSKGGRPSLPAAGDPIATSSPVFPSWSVPSWFFGDGAAFLNNVAAEFGLSSRITPADALLKPLGVNDAGNVLAGVRLTRAIRPSWLVEFGAELSAQSLDVSDDLATGLQKAASTFQATFSELLTTGPFAAPVVTAGVVSAGGTSRNVAVTAALRAQLASFGGFDSYAVAGGGVMLPMGEPTTAGLTGRYRFQIAGAVPIDETDSLTVRFRERVALVAVGGGGIRRPMSDRWGVQIDARLLAGPATTTVEVSANPSSATGAPAGFIESFTYPNLQFSNSPSTGRRSTLGPPALDRVEVFEGGWQLRARATFGIYFVF